MDAIGRWWDGVELWVTGLPFALQVLVVMVVLVPLAGAVAIAADVLLAKAFVLVGRGPADSAPEDVPGTGRPDGQEVQESTAAPEKTAAAETTSAAEAAAATDRANAQDSTESEN